VFFDREHAEYAEAVAPGLVGEDYSRAFVKSYFASIDAAAPVDKALHIDTNVMLVDDPVKRVDNMTMAWGLEARTPFLDHEVVELAARCPARLKLAQEGKGVLKEAARRVIPDGVIDRPKGYFPVPALKYLRGESLEMVRDALCGQAARERGGAVREGLELRSPERVQQLAQLEELGGVAALRNRLGRSFLGSDLRFSGAV
jgi:asparagine synthase (glutamine-hydrolysing)